MAEHTPREFVPVRIALMTVSDTRARENDTSGDSLEARVREAGHVIADRVIVHDEIKDIVAQLLKWIADPEIDAVISTGGTGLTGRDVTPEAFRSVFEKEIDGFSALFHRISYEKVGTSTIQSRACAGRGEGRLGRHPQVTARREAPAVQLRRNHAAPSGARAKDLAARVRPILGLRRVRRRP